MGSADGSSGDNGNHQWRVRIYNQGWNKPWPSETADPI
jgi:hypothetical protein